MTDHGDEEGWVQKTEAIYQKAFPDVPGDSTLAWARRYAIRERLELRRPAATVKEKKEVLEMFRIFRFERSMIDMLRHRDVGDLVLVFEHAGRIFFSDVEHHPVLPDSTPPGEFPWLVNFGQSFNRALAQADADIAAINQAILAFTGKEPPRGRSR